MKSGGAAASGGFSFQHQVSAWLATRILGEASLVFSELEQSIPVFLKCESGQVVDDILLKTANGGLVFFQAKSGALNLSQRPGSEFAKALSQFVGQFLIGRSRKDQKDEEPLNSDRDRLVLTVTPECSASIRLHLRNTLLILRGLAAEEPIANASVNEAERNALSILLNHTTRIWKESTEKNPTDAEIKRFLSLIEIQTLAVEVGGSDEYVAKDLLRSTILADSSQAENAWDRLNAVCARFAAERSGGDARRLQALLSESGIRLRAVPSYRNDIEHLRAHSRTTASLLERFSFIQLGSQRIKIRRRSTAELENIIGQSSMIVVGEPGAGKTGALHDVAERLLEKGADLVFLAADRSAASNLGALRQSLGLEHEIVDVLESWPGSDPAYLIVDGLDAARAESAGRTLRDLIRLVVQHKGRWRVLASVRRFDLRHSTELQELFRRDKPSQLPATLEDKEFDSLSHLKVPVLDDLEIGQISQESERLGSLVAGAGSELKSLLRVPFNLRLLADLLNAGIKVDELVPIKTQIELLERYWKERVKLRSGSDDGFGDAREAVLRQTCELMVELHTLRIERALIARVETSEVLSQLLSSQVLEEEQTTDILNFEHHVLFDYAVAKLLLRGPYEKLAQRLENDPDLAIIVRPSLVLHFHYLWMIDQSREIFWKVVFGILANDKVPEIGKLVGPSVAGDLGWKLSDFERLYSNISVSEVEKPTPPDKALVYLIGALLAKSPDDLLGSNAGPWCALLERLAK